MDTKQFKNTIQTLIKLTGYSASLIQNLLFSYDDGVIYLSTGTDTFNLRFELTGLPSGDYKLSQFKKLVSMIKTSKTTIAFKENVAVVSDGLLNIELALDRGELTVQHDLNLTNDQFKTYKVGDLLKSVKTSVDLMSCASDLGSGYLFLLASGLVSVSQVSCFFDGTSSPGDSYQLNYTQATKLLSMLSYADSDSFVTVSNDIIATGTVIWELTPVDQNKQLLENLFEFDRATVITSTCDYFAKNLLSGSKQLKAFKDSIIQVKGGYIKAGGNKEFVLCVESNLNFSCNAALLLKVVPHITKDTKTYITTDSCVLFTTETDKNIYLKLLKTV
jgi:hypothetical protein